MRLILKLSVLIFLALAIVLWLGKQSADDVREICATQVGTPVEQVMLKVRKLEFSKKRQAALGSGIVVYTDDETSPITWDDDSLPGFTTGRLVVGKTALQPFLRNYCELSFQNRKLIKTRTWTLD